MKEKSNRPAARRVARCSSRALTASARAGSRRLRCTGLRRCGADRGEQELLAPTATVAMLWVRSDGNEDVNPCGDDQEGNGDRERSRINPRRDHGAEIAEDQGTGAHRRGDVPVDAAAALVE